MEKTSATQVESKDWHSIPARDVIGELRTDAARGLGEADVVLRRRKFGPNKLPDEKRLEGLGLFVAQFKSPMIYILALAGMVTVFLGEYTDAVVIFAAVALNTAIGYMQENKASNALAELKRVLKVKAFAVRGGVEREVPQEELVPGDVIVLKPGFKIPADARLVDARELKVNESALTGEWLPADKSVKTLPANTPLADRDNMVYMGALVESGHGRAVVTATGPSTKMGDIAGMLKESKEEQTPYQLKLANFSRVVGIVILAICAGILVEGMLSGAEFGEMFVTSVAVAVAAIPEGLPVAMTVILAIGAQRILKRKGLVRRLASAETLGSTSVICTDKTGTLTEARMDVASITTATRRFAFGDGRGLKAAASGGSSHALAMRIAVSCSEAVVENPRAPVSAWKVSGRPTDRALVLAAGRAGITRAAVDADMAMLAGLPFDPTKKYSASLRRTKTDRRVLHVLGAPELLLSKSAYVDFDGKRRRMNRLLMQGMRRRLDETTGMGMRVLAAAYKDGVRSRSLKHSDIGGLVFAGFISLEDPIRPGVRDAIGRCRRAGLKPVIVTGDNRLTAMAVAKGIGMDVAEADVMEGTELEGLSDPELADRAKSVRVYARVEPAQKLRIVRALQANGEVVAMTGDGVNDAPALKQADIGVAVGSGTDLAKDVSDLVLLKDDFSVIVAAVEEGRVIIDNIRKVVTYLLSDSFTEVVLVGGSVLAGLPLPVTAAQILWVNLIEDGLPSIALAFEPREKDVMRHKPERHDAPLLTREMKAIIFMIGLTTDAILFGVFMWLLSNGSRGAGMGHVRTMMFACLAIDSLLYVFSCKSLRSNIWRTDLLSNKLLLASVGFGFAMLVAAVYAPPLQLLLDTVPLAWSDWALVLGLGFLNVTLIELTKWWFISRHEAV
ncbi:MAG: HAD-IC family P-type ATPase [Candidatus Aenigmatarchaeota archaeon]